MVTATLPSVPIAVVVLDFDPVVRFAGLAVRLDTLIVAAGVVLALLVAALLARGAGRDDPDGLRIDDLLFIVLAAVPGGVVGGRLGYVLLHLDYYRTSPAAIVDPGQGGLELLLGVVGAGISGGYAARLLGPSAGVWFHAAAIPTLLAVAGGKLAMAVGGTGQGSATDLPWATAYAGPGPWGSLSPALPAHPAQLYEAALVALIVVALTLAGMVGAFDRRDGVAWLAAVGSWAMARGVVAITWRDAPVAGPLRVEQLIVLAVLLGCAVAARVVRGAPAVQPHTATGWPDARPRRRA
jgi:phosphatidylglycerol:prolipoprotein diacylglycerol transferase